MHSNVIKKLLKPIKSQFDKPFEGQIYSIGKASVSILRPEKIDRTVICIPGFLESYQYFTEVYSTSHNTELLLFTPCNYHIPARNPQISGSPIPMPVNYAENTIEYDATALIEAFRMLKSSENVLIHGHSRGGAVIVEAISRYPELFKDVEVILEAPVLPQGKLYPLMEFALNKVNYANFPWLMNFAKNAPLFFHIPTIGKVTQRKKDLASKFFSSTKNYMTVVRNIDNIFSWMEKTPCSALKSINKGTILIPETDRVLDVSAMRTSAQYAGISTKIVNTKGTSHFILLDDRKLRNKLARSKTRNVFVTPSSMQGLRV